MLTGTKGFKPSASDDWTSSGSFEEELTELLRRRTRTVLWIALVVSAAFTVFLIELPPELEGGLTPWRGVVRMAQLASFALGLLVTYTVNCSARHFQRLAFWITAVNMVVVMFVMASVAPSEEPYLVAAMSLFIYAAFIPSPARYPALLGILALFAFVISAVTTFVWLPEARAFWAEMGGAISGEAALGNHLILGGSGIVALGAVAYVTSRTLYSLRRSVHQAERLGNYVVERELGQGGMGQVFQARHALIRRPTAVKVMSVGGDDAESAIARFEREVQLSATLTHPNNITIYDFGRTPDNQFFYAMEFLEGLDLQKLIDQHGPLPAERAVYVLAQACGALNEAHSRGIIHRDIKPSNIFLTVRGGIYDFVKVLDFGLAKQITADDQLALTKTGLAVGTPRYISPEAVKGSDSLDARSDIYCLGVVAFCTLTGRPPFEAASSVEVMIDHLKAEPPRPSQVGELPIPNELDEIVLTCLAKPPEDRFQSAAELEAALRGLQLAEPWTQERARAWWEVHGIGQPEGGESGVDETDLSNRGISRFFYVP